MHMSGEHALVSIIQNENDMTVHKIAGTQTGGKERKRAEDGYSEGVWKKKKRKESVCVYVIDEQNTNNSNKNNNSNNNEKSVLPAPAPEHQQRNRKKAHEKLAAWTRNAFIVHI